MNSMSYSEKVKQEKSVSKPDDCKQKYLNDEELEYILRLTDSNKYKDEKFTTQQSAVIDVASERLCDLYFDIRVCLHDHFIHHDTDYNKFLDLILNNMTIMEADLVSDDETADLDEVPEKIYL